MRDEIFADEYSPINTARSSFSSQYSGSYRPPSGHDRSGGADHWHQKQTQKQKQQKQQQQLNEQKQKIQQHHHLQKQHQLNLKQHHQQRLSQQQKRKQQKSRVTDSYNNDDDNDDVDGNGESDGGDTTPLSSPCKERSARNFDDDESSKEEVSVDKANFWLRSGYNDDNGGERGGGGSGGGGGDCGGYHRGSSGGSATVEDSWNYGMGKAIDDETPSTSRVGSSGRSSSRSGGHRPSRRYLVEQNRPREGW